MNLSKELKKKRDSEDRLRNSSPQKIFFEGGYVDLSQLALKNHTHKFIDLTDAPNSYVADKFVKVNADGTGLEYDDGGGGIAEIPQATDTTIGGVKAKDRTTESAEVAIDTSTGKLFAPVSEGGSDFDVYSIGGYTVEDFESETQKIPYTLNAVTRTFFDSTRGYVITSPYTYKDNHYIEFIVDVDANIDASFMYKTNLEYSGAASRVYIDGVHIGSLDSTTWVEFAFQIPAGQHVIKIARYNYSKRDSQFWLDDFKIPTEGLKGMQAVNANPASLLLTASDGSRVGFMPLVGIMQKSKGETLPIPAEELRGQIFTLEGGVGIADTSYICKKNATDTYEWVAI